LHVIPARSSPKSIPPIPENSEPNVMTGQSTPNLPREQRNPCTEGDRRQTSTRQTMAVESLK
jgi:hypothetical protein